MTIPTAASRFAERGAGKLRVAFVGATSFGRRCFERALALPEIEGVGVLSAPRTFSISYRPQGVTNVRHDDLGAFAMAHALPFHELAGRMSEPEVVDLLRGWRPELFLVVGWYHMIPRGIRAIAPAFGLHASLLPDYRGGAPLVWALIHGERRTGITLFEMDDGVDSGPILGQRAVPIHEHDTIATLYAAIEEAGLELVAEQLPLVARAEATFRAQDGSRRRVFPQRGPEDGRVDWSWDARRIYDFVRAQTRPYPGAFSTLGGVVVHLWRVRVVASNAGSTAVDSTTSEQPGHLFPGPRAGGACVRCGQGSAVELLDVSVDGSAASPLELLALARASGRAAVLGANAAP